MSETTKNAPQSPSTIRIGVGDSWPILVLLVVIALLCELIGKHSLTVGGVRSVAPEPSRSGAIVNTSPQRHRQLHTGAWPITATRARRTVQLGFWG
jgi:hypothetical protein